MKQICFKKQQSTLNYPPPSGGSEVNPWTNILGHCGAAGCSQRQRVSGGVEQPNTTQQSWRGDCISQTDETATVALPLPEQIMISVTRYHLFNINEIFNEVPNCRLISPSLISTGDI